MLEDGLNTPKTSPSKNSRFLAGGFGHRSVNDRTGDSSTTLAGTESSDTSQHN
jgi:hypothetical protein